MNIDQESGNHLSFSCEDNHVPEDEIQDNPFDNNPYFVVKLILFYTLVFTLRFILS